MVKGTGLKQGEASVTDAKIRRANQIGALLAVSTASDDVDLPSVAEAGVDTESGGSRALYAGGEQMSFMSLPWVGRELDSALRTKDFVFLVGSTKAARWMAGWEAVRRTFPDARFLVPRSGSVALVELLGLEPPLRTGDAGVVVVWLDRFERYLGIGQGIDGELLGRLQALAPRVVVMATVESNIREYLLHTDGQLLPTARLILEQAATVVLPNDPAASASQTETRGHKNDRKPVIGEPSVLQRWQDGLRALGDTGTADAAGLGTTLVQAAVDWRRMGVFRPIAEAELRELTRLSPHCQTSTFDDAHWGDALRWALARPPGISDSLLQETHSEDAPVGRSRVFQAAEFLASHHGLPDIPLPAWEFVLRHCDAFELIGVATRARDAGEPDVADSALQQASRNPDPAIAALAGFLFGSTLQNSGDTPGALAAYRQIVADGGNDRDIRALQRRMSDSRSNTGQRDEPAEYSLTAVACFTMAQSLADQGRTAEAIAAYREAISLDDLTTTVLAAHNLASLLRDQGDAAAARSAYEQALTASVWADDPAGVLGPTAHDLGDLLESEGEIAAALIAFEIAVDSGHFGAAPRAARRMGTLLNAQGNKTEAMAAFRRAAEAEDTQTAAAAEVQLAAMIEKTDPEQALAMYRKAAACGDPLVTGAAVICLGQLLRKRGDLRGAELAYRQGMEPGRTNPDAAAESALQLGMLLDGRDDTDGASSAYREAMNSGHPKWAPAAAYGLGRLLLMRRDFIDACHAFDQAARLGDPPIAAQAHLAKSEALICLGDVRGARRAATLAASSGVSSVRERAKEQLDRLKDE